MLHAADMRISSQFDLFVHVLREFLGLSSRSSQEGLAKRSDLCVTSLGNGRKHGIGSVDSVLHWMEQCTVFQSR